MHNPVVTATAMTFCNENIAVARINHNVIRPVQAFRITTGMSQRHKNFAVGTEFDDLITQHFIGTRISHPKISFVINRCAMGKQEKPLTKARQQPAGIVKFENRIFWTTFTGIFKAPMHYIDCFTVRSRLNCCHCRPGLRIVGQLAPVPVSLERTRQIVAHIMSDRF